MNENDFSPMQVPQEVLDGKAEIFIAGASKTANSAVFKMETHILPISEPSFLHFTAGSKTLYTPNENIFSKRFRGCAHVEYQDGTKEDVSIEVTADHPEDAKKKFEIELYGAFLQAGYTKEIKVTSFEEDKTPKIPVEYVKDVLTRLNSLPDAQWETTGKELEKELCERFRAYNPNWWTDGYPELFEHCKNHTLEQMADEFVPGYPDSQKILALAAFQVATLDLEWTYAYFPEYPLEVQYERAQTYDYYEEIEQDLDF